MPDLMEQPLEPLDTATQPTRHRPPNRQRVRPHKNHTGLLLLIFLCTLVSATASSGMAYLYWQSLQAEADVEPPLAPIEEVIPVEYLSFGSHSVPINPSLPTNDYDQSAFVVGDDGIISYPGGRLGVDVSSHQGTIDWQAVAADGVSFAIIRLGFRGYGANGTLVLDTNFYENIEGAKAAGLDVGVYFFSQATSVWETLEESYFVLEHLEGYTLELPVVFDWEFIDNSSVARTNGEPGQCITLYNQVFNEQLEKAGYDTMIYFNQSLAYLYLELDVLADHPFWLASYRNNPTFHYHFHIWQYTDKGTIDGINGLVDLNLMLTDLTVEEEITP